MVVLTRSKANKMNNTGENEGTNMNEEAIVEEETILDWGNSGTSAREDILAKLGGAIKKMGLLSVDDLKMLGINAANAEDEEEIGETPRRNRRETTSSQLLKNISPSLTMHPHSSSTQLEGNINRISNVIAGNSTGSTLQDERLLTTLVEALQTRQAPKTSPEERRKEVAEMIPELSEALVDLSRRPKTTPQRFFSQLENWLPNTSDRVKMMAIKLKGSAKLIFQNMLAKNPKVPYAELKEELLQRLKSPIEPFDCLYAMVNMKCDEKETILKFVEKMRNLGEQWLEIDPTAAQFVDQTMVYALHKILPVWVKMNMNMNLTTKFADVYKKLISVVKGNEILCVSRSEIREAQHITVIEIPAPELENTKSQNKYMNPLEQAKQNRAGDPHANSRPQDVSSQSKTETNQQKWDKNKNGKYKGNQQYYQQNYQQPSQQYHQQQSQPQQHNQQYHPQQQQYHPQHQQYHPQQRQYQGYRQNSHHQQGPNRYNPGWGQENYQGYDRQQSNHSQNKHNYKDQNNQWKNAQQKNKEQSKEETTEQIFRRLMKEKEGASQVAVNAMQESKVSHFNGSDEIEVPTFQYAGSQY